ncbi:helix-turn-helix transcriptional regulator [Glacieibacterium frigidum]|uniref:Helix-turn-helix transcriptional regulator n=1 Tax=Glacieibacterium frigidum TaxID=2593303 RepID=A0A552U7D9_9SPHN|nr:AraC family transcriptional regulator [Glacieibacterium frigidum]TRW14135.1 helix-turn-helix transcriptional regulator [Glacieibacterium frigidum]
MSDASVFDTVRLMEIVHVSPEMVTLIGAGPLPVAEFPADPVALMFVDARVMVVAAPDCRAELDGGFALVVAREALDRLFGWGARACDGGRYHLSHQLRRVTEALLSRDRVGEALKTYRLAKSIELLCETVPEITAGTLVPDIPLGPVDTRRILMARQIIDERWSEPLTLAAIARACGLNRAKLTRGFRALFSSSVAEALLERRLDEARRALLTTDLPVGQVAYRNGYLNNASFTRAFGRRYGQSPTDCRARAMAA